MVLLRGGVQLLIIDVDSPFHQKACLDLLVFLVRCDCYSRFLRNNVHRTHPLAIRYGIDDFFQGFPYLGVESSLGLPDGS